VKIFTLFLQWVFKNVPPIAPRFDLNPALYSIITVGEKKKRNSTLLTLLAAYLYVQKGILLYCIYYVSSWYYYCFRNISVAGNVRKLKSRTMRTSCDARNLTKRVRHGKLRTFVRTKRWERKKIDFLPTCDLLMSYILQRSG